LVDRASKYWFTPRNNGKHSFLYIDIFFLKRSIAWHVPQFYFLNASHAFMQPDIAEGEVINGAKRRAASAGCVSPSFSFSVSLSICS
jgi:hypothetical protein